MGQSESCECGARTADLHEKDIATDGDADEEEFEGDEEDDTDEIPYNKPKTEHYQRGFKTFMSICSDDHRAVASWLAPRIAQLQHTQQRAINILSVGAGVGRLDSLLLRSLHTPPARYVAVEMNAQYTANLKQALRKVERAGKVKSTTVVVESGFEDMKTTEEFDVIIISHALSYMKNQERIIRRAISLLHDQHGLIFCMAGLNQLLTIAPKYNPKYKPNRNSLDGPKLQRFLETIRNTNPNESNTTTSASSPSSMLFSLESGQTDSYMDMGKFASLSTDDKHDVMTMMLQNDTRFFSSSLIESFESDLASQATRRQTGSNNSQSGSPLASPNMSPAAVSSPFGNTSQSQGQGESSSSDTATGTSNDVIMGRPCGSAMFMLVLPYTTPTIVWSPTPGVPSVSIPPPTPRASVTSLSSLPSSITPSSSVRALLPHNITTTGAGGNGNGNGHHRNDSNASSNGDHKNDSSPNSSPLNSPAAAATATKVMVAPPTPSSTTTSKAGVSPPSSIPQAGSASPSLRYTGVSVGSKGGNGPSLLRLDQPAPVSASAPITNASSPSPSMTVRTLPLTVVTGASAATTPVTSPDNTPKGAVTTKGAGGANPNHGAHGHNRTNSQSRARGHSNATVTVAPVAVTDDDEPAPWE